jgi:hypothetical protein
MGAVFLRALTLTRHMRVATMPGGSGLAAVSIHSSRLAFQ